MPRVHDGTLHYTVMEIVQSGPLGGSWSVREKEAEAPVPTMPTTGNGPDTVTVATGIASATDTKLMW